MTDLDAVVALVEAVAAALVVGGSGVEAWEKAPGEVVTQVDVEVERALIDGLGRIAPGVPVVGEEDPSLLPLLGEDAPVWVLDPLDGTPAFLAGSPDHAVMLALVERREVVAAVVHQPAHGRTFTAQRGSGAYEGGRRLRAGPGAPGVAVLRRFLPPDVALGVDRAFAGRDTTPSCTTAGVLYPDVADGALGRLLFWRTLPWDHAAGSLLVTEAGGTVVRPDGGPYRPGDPGEGLLVCGAGWDPAEVLGALGS